MKVDMTHRGLPEADAMMRLLANMGAAYSGIEMAGFKRNESKLNNAEVVNYLAEGGRDITATDEDATEAAQIFKAVADQALQRMANKSIAPPTGKGISGATKAASAAQSQIANHAMAKALKGAATLIQRKLSDRVEAGEDNTGNKKAVTETYAKQRLSKYGVPEDEVLKASGQLLDNLQGSGGMRLIK